MPKYTVLLLDAEESDHEIEIHHVKADTPAKAVMVAINAVVADMTDDDSDELDRLGSELSVLEVMKPMAVFKGHVVDVIPATILTATARRCQRVRAEYDRLVDDEVERRAALAKTAAKSGLRAGGRKIVTAKKPTRRPSA